MEQDMEHDSASEHQHKETDRLISSTEEKPTYNTTDASGDGVSQKSSSAPASPHQQQENPQDGGQQQDVQDGSEGPTAAADTSRTSNQSDPDAIKVLNTSNRSGGSGSGGAGSRQGSPAAKDARYSISARDQLQHMVIAGLVLSIIACIVFVILGIPALIFACRAQAELKYGTPQRSRKQANIAVTLGTIGTALGIALWILLTWFVFLKF